MYKRKQSSDQKAFFISIKSIVSDKKDFVIKVSELLGISLPGAYKKIDGSSKLSYDELIKICTGFDVSFDQIAHGSSMVRNAYPFYSEALKFKPSSIHHYWSNQLEHMERIKDLPGLDAIYLANEIPIFYFLQFPKLLHFKMFVWDQTSWHLLSKNRVYNKNVFQQDKELQVVITELNKFYNNQRHTEIWNPDMLRLTMTQLNYYISSFAFKEIEDIKEIIADMEKMIVHMRDVCEKGVKSIFGKRQGDTPVHIYLNELVINSEMIYITSDNFRLLYNKYDPPNHIRSDDSRVCDHIEEWLEDIINQSTLISKYGQKDRDRLFNTIFADFEIFKQRVENIIKGMS